MRNRKEEQNLVLVIYALDVIRRNIHSNILHNRVSTNLKQNPVTRQSCWIIGTWGCFEGLKLEPSAIICFHTKAKQNSDKCTESETNLHKQATVQCRIASMQNTSTFVTKVRD